MEISGRRFTAQQNAEEIRQQAQIRWFGAAEICEMIANHESLGILISEQPETPASGSFFMIPRQSLRKFRKDGHLWSKKKDGKTIQESHVNLKVGGVEMVECLYVHGEENENFQRRNYRMLKGGPLHIALFHYREDKEAGKYSKRNKKTTKITAQSFQETGKAIPILGIIGDGMPVYKSEFQNQPFSQETKNNFLSDPDTPGGYYELQESKKPVEQFSEENWKNYKRSKKLNILEVTGFPSTIVNHETVQLPVPSSVDHESYQLALPPQTAYTSSLNEIQGYAKLGDGLLDYDNNYEDESYCSTWFTGGGMQDYNNDFKNHPFSHVFGNDFLPNLSTPGSPCELSELMKSMEQFSERKKEDLKGGNEIPGDLAK